MYKVSDLMNEMAENEGKDTAPCLMFFFSSFDHVDVMLLSRIFLIFLCEGFKFLVIFSVCYNCFCF